MMSGPPNRIALLLAATSLLGGCAETGSVFSRRTTMGSLKTSVSHLEYENEQLRAKNAKLEAETREIENRLVQEESANGELTARLNDAKYELSRRGLDFGDERTSAPSRDESSSEVPSTRPAGQSTRKRRKAPFAQIPARIEEEPAEEEPGTSLKLKPSDDLGPQSLLDDPDRWLPVARGTTAPSTKMR